MQSGQSFASQLVNFLKVSNVWHLQPLLRFVVRTFDSSPSAYCQRLNFGVKPDILPLTEIPGIHFYLFIL